MTCYVGDGELICETCAIGRDDIKADHAAIGGESDTPQHCGECHRPLFEDFGLTADGIDYVIKAIETRLREGTAPTDWRWQGGYYVDCGKHEVLREWATYLRWDSNTSLDRREERLCEWFLHLTAPGTHGHPTLIETPAERDERIEREHSGYNHCACRDCFEIYVGPRGRMCEECIEAGCERGCECQREEAYGGAEGEALS